MAKEIVWSRKAHDDRKAILDYWRDRNKSYAYSIELNSLIKDSVRLITRFPKIGRETDVKNVRVKVIRDYLLIYEDHADRIAILSMWDTRQDPEKLKRTLG